MCQHSEQMQIERIMNISSSAYQLHQISDTQFAVQLNHNQLGYAQLEQIMREHEQNRNKLAIIEQTLISYDWYQRDTSIQTNNVDSLLKKAMKYKQLKEENKKLKKLLQNQLQNTQRVREQTQKTMKVLRQEFDTLVRQMSRPNAQRVNPPLRHLQAIRQ